MYLVVEQRREKTRRGLLQEVPPIGASDRLSRKKLKPAGRDKV